MTSNLLHTFLLNGIATAAPSSLDGAEVAPFVITLERAAHSLGLEEDDALDVLVDLRIWLHNISCAMAADEDDADESLADFSETLNALTELADHLDQIDVVYASLPTAVAEGSPVIVPLLARQHAAHDKAEGSVGLGAHETVWRALRASPSPATLANLAQPAAWESLQLSLPFDVEVDDQIKALVATLSERLGRRGARHGYRCLAPVLPKQVKTAHCMGQGVAKTKVVIDRAAGEPRVARETRTGARQ